MVTRLGWLLPAIIGLLLYGCEDGELQPIADAGPDAGEAEVGPKDVGPDERSPEVQLDAVGAGTGVMEGGGFRVRATVGPVRPIGPAQAGPPPSAPSVQPTSPATAE